MVHYYKNRTKSKIPSEITCLHHLYSCLYSEKKIIKLFAIKLRVIFENCFDLLEMCDKTQSVYSLSVPFRLIRSICFLSVKCESMYFKRKIKFMPCYWEFLFYQTCLGRSVCNRKIKLRNFLKVGAKKKRKFKKIHSELTKQRTHKTSPKNLVHFLAKTKILSWKHIYYYYPAPPILWLEGVAWTVEWSHIQKISGKVAKNCRKWPNRKPRPSKLWKFLAKRE